MNHNPAGNAPLPAGDPHSGGVVWHRKFGFGVTVAAKHSVDEATAATVDFGPHWGQRDMAIEAGRMQSVPGPADVKELSVTVHHPGGFKSAQDPVAAALSEPAPSAAALRRAIESWDESVGFIERGGVDQEDYEQYVGEREGVERSMSWFAAANGLDPLCVSSVQAVDRRFWSCTRPSAICVWHAQARYQVIGNFVGICREWYDSGRFWCYYRWPPEDAAALEGHDVFSWQREKFGLDFLQMDEQQLRDRVLELADRVRQGSARY